MTGRRLLFHRRLDRLAGRDPASSTGGYRDFTEVRPRLCLGARPRSATNLVGLFDAVVDLRLDPGSGPETVYTAAGMPYYRLPIHDGLLPTGWEAELDRAEAWITAQLGGGRRVLVHCDAGVSRSAFVLVYYLMRSEGLSAHAAINALRGRRSKVNPHAAFREALTQITG